MENNKWICLGVETLPSKGNSPVQTTIEFCPYWKDIPGRQTVGRLQLGTYDNDVVKQFEVRGIYELVLTRVK